MLLRSLSRNSGLIEVAYEMGAVGAASAAVSGYSGMVRLFFAWVETFVDGAEGAGLRRGEGARAGIGNLAEPGADLLELRRSELECGCRHPEAQQAHRFTANTAALPGVRRERQ